MGPTTVEADTSSIVALRILPGWRGKADLMSRLLAERGYQVVFQNCRGTFGSTGEFEPFRNEREDGLATLEWLATQPWFSGSVAMFGLSYYGYVQLASGAGAPDYLKALVPQMAASRVYGVLRGEPMRLDGALSWLYTTYNGHLATSLLDKTRVTLRRTSALRAGFQHLPVGEADHAALGRPIPFFQDIVRYGRPEDDLWAATDNSKHVPGIQAPVHFLAGWYDFFLRDELADYQALRDAGKNPYLTIGPWTHASLPGMKAGFKESLEWYDAHLRGDVGALRSAPVRVCVMGADTWVDLPSWPPPSTPVLHYLRAGGSSSTEPPASQDQPSRYRYDPADPTPSLGGAVISGGGAKDNRKLEARPDVLTFTGDPVRADTTIMGTVSVSLHARSTLDHTDFFARLCDVAPKGTSTNLCDGIIRLDQGGTRQVTISLTPTAHCFKPGHRIRLQISSGAHPMYDRNPGTGEPLATTTAMRPADQEILHDAAHPSALILPVV
ncbi:CocE/NonD family hydrolase [Nonomuraea sp. NPDC051941]|uniref:CocE/NonD family hydrolase n=1 Tax=Nonomuraea sp. NPDC051941 TaxID=3364373 RepID=UPI0037CC3D06